MSAFEIPCSDASKDVWKEWISVNSDTINKGEEDFGLARIAKHLGETQSEALRLYWDGAEKESSEGDVDGAIKLYRRAFKMWPA
jgi:hypothetical protein